MEVKDLHFTIADVLDLVQTTTSAHQKNVYVLKKLLETNTLEQFMEAFKMSLHTILLSGYKSSNTYAEKAVQFIAVFCTSVSDIFNGVIEFLLQVHDNANEIVRFRATQVIGKILQELKDMNIDADLWTALFEALKARLKDGKVSVRMQASTYLVYLHSLETELVTESYINSMKDNSAKVRRLCVKNCPLNSTSISHIIDCTRDVSAAVRLAAFDRLQENPASCQIEDRQKIIQNGFSDQSAAVKQFMTDVLVPKWLQFYSNDYLNLFSHLRLDADWDEIDSSVDVIKHVAGVLFQKSPHSDLINVLVLDENGLLAIDQLNWDTVVYWRLLIQHLGKFDEHNPTLISSAPQLVRLCEFIESYYKSMENHEELEDHKFLEYQFCLRELFTITESYDFSNVAGRDILMNLITKLLKVTKPKLSVVEKIVDNIITGLDDGAADFVCKLISDMLYSTKDELEEVQDQHEFEIAKHKVNLQNLMDERDANAANRDFIKAQELQEQIQLIEEALVLLKTTEVKQEDVIVKTEDTTILIHCLNITIALLKSPCTRRLNSMLRTLKDDVIQDLLLSDNYAVKVKAIRAYGLCCIIDRKTAESGIHLFCAIMSSTFEIYEQDVQMLTTAIKTVVDLICVYGATLIATPTDNLSDSVNEQQESIFKGGSSLTPFVQKLLELMQSDFVELEDVSADGLCRLIFSGSVKSADVISHLVIKWCNPSTGEDLRQTIGRTLENLSLIPDSSDQLVNSIVTTLKILSKAPRSSPLIEVNIENISKIMVSLCKTYPEHIALHLQLATNICYSMRNKPRQKCNLILSKTLLMLTLDGVDLEHQKELLTICNEIRDNVVERFTIANIIKFCARLNEREACMPTISEESRVPTITEESA